MDLFILLVSLCLCFLIKPLITFLLSSSSKPIYKNLPPGPPRFSFLSNFILGRKSFFELGPLVSKLSHKYGPLISIHLGSTPTVYITNNSLAHQALIQNGAVFADRPQSINNIIVSSSKKIISKSPYGPVWRALRRNLTAGVLHPSQLKSFSSIRNRVLMNLINNLKLDSNGGDKPIYVENHFRHAVFSMLVLLCFGNNVDKESIQVVEAAQLRLFRNFHRFKLFIIFPRLGKFLFKKLWKELNGIVTGYDDVIVPLIEARKKELMEQESSRNDEECSNTFYVDTLLNLQVPGEEGNIKDGDVVGLCNEFISAGTDTTMISLQWIMANVVKYPEIQARILEEIKNVIGNDGKCIGEDDLQKMPYLKAVILEGLRKHPPGYAPATPHAVTEDVELAGYTVPKGTAVNFLIADMGRDPRIWENPMEFKPERFLKSESFDVTGSREIKMMPFGAGRRICPGYGLAMLHMEYLVANLVWNFEWLPVEGEEIDLTEKFGLTVTMKSPLRICLSPRF